MTYHIPFIKCHGSGNQFIIIDESTIPFSLRSSDRSTLAIQLCHPSDGFNVDGVLFYQKSDGFHWDCSMRIVNADGSEAEMCGNGIRCIGRYHAELTGKTNIQIKTMKGILFVSQMKQEVEHVPFFETDIAPVSFHPSSLPMIFSGETCLNQTLSSLSEIFTFSALSVPNPHAIAIVPQIDEKELYQIGKRSNESHHLFPKGVNVSFCQILDHQKIFVSTYERGVGLTHSCGTGMTAATIVCCKLNYTIANQPIHVFNKGGLVICTAINESKDSWYGKLSGNATFISKGIFIINWNDQCITHYEIEYTYDQEQTAYNNLTNSIVKRGNKENQQCI